MVSGAFSPETPFTLYSAPLETFPDAAKPTPVEDVATSVLRSAYDDLRNVRDAIRILPIFYNQMKLNQVIDASAYFGPGGGSQFEGNPTPIL